MAGLFYSSIFGELTKQVQVRIDTASELRKRLFDQNIYEKYLDWEAPDRQVFQDCEPGIPLRRPDGA